MEQKLPIELKEKWVKALRSGEYAQTTGTLCDDNVISDSKRYCCLGVLCKVVGMEKVNGLVLDGEWITKYGIPEMMIGTGDENNIVGTLIIMNDGILPSINEDTGEETEGTPSKSFNEIADYIEQNL